MIASGPARMFGFARADVRHMRQPDNAEAAKADFGQLESSPRATPQP